MESIKFKVFIYLDGINPILCGRGISRKESFDFKYDAGYLGLPEATAIDPVYFPLQDKIISRRSILGSLRDSSPDSWGQKLMDIFAGRRLLPAHYLLATGEDRVGDLAFCFESENLPRAWRPWEANVTKYVNLLSNVNLEEITQAFDELDADLLEDYVKEIISRYMSIGGSRPKATVFYKGKICLAKFELRTDSFDNPRAEYATMKLARACGIVIPEVHLTNVRGRDIYFIERFDKRVVDGNLIRRGFISAATAMKTEEGSYEQIADFIRKYGSKERFSEDLLQLYKRMVFNVLCSNYDDHSRNHGLLRKGQFWELSPAYDIVPSTLAGMTHSMDIGKLGRVGSKANLLSRCERFGLDRDTASELIGNMQEKLSAWEGVFKECGLTSYQIEGYRKCFKLREF